MSATPGNNSNIDQGSSTSSKEPRTQPSKSDSGDGGGGSDVISSGVGAINSCSDTSFSGNTIRKNASANGDVRSSVVTSSTLITSSNNSTSTSPPVASIVSDASASINLTLIPSSMATLTNTSAAAEVTSGQDITSSGNGNSGTETANLISKHERGSLNYTRNGSISDSRTSTVEHRTPNLENLSKTNLYIRGLSTNTTDEILFNLCSRFGSITSTKAILDKVTGICRGMLI